MVVAAIALGRLLQSPCARPQRRHARRLAASDSELTSSEADMPWVEHRHRALLGKTIKIIHIDQNGHPSRLLLDSKMRSYTRFTSGIISNAGACLEDIPGK